MTTGRAWVFGDEIDTDRLAPGAYMKAPLAELAAHCLEAVDPDFAKKIRPGDIVVAGRGFGMGSSREQAAQALKHLGVAAILATSFGGIFYRNALNHGLLALVCADVARIRPFDIVEVDAINGTISNRTTGDAFPCEVMPSHLLRMITDGGLIPHLQKRLAAKA